MPFSAEKQTHNTTRTLQGSDDMAKKYLTIEEAAEIIGVDPSDLTRLREKGEIRAFADRGNWKFRQDDVEELARKRQADSDPDVPMFKAPKKPADDLEGTFVFEEPITPGSGDSSINLGDEAPDEIIGNQPTIVRKGGLDDLMGSDSDVRLVFDDSLMPDNSDDVLSDSHSDSDVRLINFDKPKDDGSDSDVKLVPDNKASVKTPSNKKDEASDSDVTLIGKNSPPSDEFTLDLDQSDGSFVFGGESSGIALGGFDADDDQDSGITLDLGGDSGIALDAGDSGISLDPGGSGISLEPDDSSLVLAGDSGISLGGPSDSGIALEGGSKAKNKNKGKKPAQDLGGTMPEIPMMSAPQDDLGNTQMEVPMLGATDSEFEFTASPLDEDSSTNFALLGEEDSTVKKGGRKGKKQDEDDDLFDTSSTVEFEADESDEFDSNADVFADSSDDMEVADDVIGEDDEIAEDVFGAADEDFDEELQSGQSAADFAVPSMSGPRVSAPIQAEWGGAAFGMLLVSSAVMLLTSFMMYDVVRTMWGNNEPNAGTEMILSSFRGMFG